MRNESTKAIYKLLVQNCGNLDSALVWGVSDIHATSYSSLKLLSGLMQLRI